MSADQKTALQAVSGPGESGSTLRLSPVFDSDKAAEALALFLREARSILEAVETSYRQAEGQTPARRARKRILRFLAEEGEAVELRDLPAIAEIGTGRGKRLIEEMVKDGHLDLQRSETYPNMMYLDITPAGGEELRRMDVREAMSWLHGVNCNVSEAVGTARRALNGLVEAIARQSW